ncbi:MAG: hypothetical protein Q9214_004555 [Letrouitia sp. 1 TL-2023]
MENRDATTYGDHKTKLRAEEFCRQLYGHDSPEPIGAVDLDGKLSKVFRFKFEPLEDSLTIFQQVCDLVERMPARPPELNDIPTTIPLEYHVSSVAENVRKDSLLWEQLRVTTYLSSTILRAALGAAIDPNGIQASLKDITNIIAKLLETVSQLAPTVTDVRTRWRSFIKPPEMP